MVPSPSPQTTGWQTIVAAIDKTGKSQAKLRGSQAVISHQVKQAKVWGSQAVIYHQAKQTKQAKLRGSQAVLSHLAKQA